jgi:UDP-N-acetylglucosamine--N-acetylmuramyl-(pentapeptide) pyrophosphoryl-undecaprenol N-acetylglucosamine transferase
MLAPLAHRIYVSFENTQLKKSRPLSERAANKIRVSGNPIRTEILAYGKQPRETPIIHSDKKKRFTILVIGGSQGAHRINMAVIDAMVRLKQKEKFLFIHQTGPKDETRVREVYAVQCVSSRVESFFDDMASQYQKADLVVCRAGASTVAEVTAMGKGVIFIPYPYAADDHQFLNARALAETGAAEMIREEDLNGEILAERIEYYASNLEDLHKMADRAKGFSRPDAASAIVNDCYALINGR